MSLQLSIPDSVLSAIRLPESRLEQALLQELAIALYTQELLSFGSRELAQIGKYEFGQLIRTAFSTAALRLRRVGGRLELC